MTSDETTQTKSKYSPVATTSLEDKETGISDDFHDDDHHQATTRTKSKYAPLEISEEQEEYDTDTTDEDLHHRRLELGSVRWVWILILLLAAVVAFVARRASSNTHPANAPMSSPPVPYQAPTDLDLRIFTTPPTISPKNLPPSSSKRTNYGEAFYDQWQRMDLDDSILRLDWKTDLHFSLAMSDDGTVLAVGDPAAAVDGHEDMGKAFVYYRDISERASSVSSSSWTLMSTITSCDVASSDVGCHDHQPAARFGHTVQLSGDASILVVGGMFLPNNKDETLNSLLVYCQRLQKGHYDRYDYQLGLELDRAWEYVGHASIISFSQNSSRYAVISSRNRSDNDNENDTTMGNTTTTDTVQIFEWVAKEDDWVWQVNLVPYDYQIYDVAMSADGTRVAFTSYEKEHNAHVFDLQEDTGQWIDIAALDMTSPATNCSGAGAWLEMSSNGRKILLVANCLDKPMTIVTFYQPPKSSQWTPLHWSHTKQHAPEYALDMSGDGNTFALVTYDPTDDTMGRLELFEWDDGAFWRPFDCGMVFLGNLTFPSAVALSQDGSTMAIATTSMGDDRQSFLDVYQLIS